jgi:hypothetical protein
VDAYKARPSARREAFEGVEQEAEAGFEGAHARQLERESQRED